MAPLRRGWTSTDVRGFRRTPTVSPPVNFRSFCGDSIKACFLGISIENDRSYALDLTQIGSAVIQRKDNCSLEFAKFERPMPAFRVRQGSYKF